ncbi:hypothetical protein C8R44DRAFT_873682 [Mycena epipterygia]|nr:hypothetical protein C8R44DRAFT_873682 [Mycena epipterygia]
MHPRARPRYAILRQRPHGPPPRRPIPIPIPNAPPTPSPTPPATVAPTRNDTFRRPPTPTPVLAGLPPSADYSDFHSTTTLGTPGSASSTRVVVHDRARRPARDMPACSHHPMLVGYAESPGVIPAGGAGACPRFRRRLLKTFLHAAVHPTTPRYCAVLQLSAPSFLRIARDVPLLPSARLPRPRPRPPPAGAAVASIDGAS